MHCFFWVRVSKKYQKITKKSKRIKKFKKKFKRSKIFKTSGQGGQKMSPGEGGGEEGYEVKPDQPWLVKRNTREYQEFL